MAWTDMTQLTGLVAWYKPESLASSYSDGDAITTWADSSGNSRDLTGSGLTAPVAAASAINGYMAADFDGNDDILSSAGYSQNGQIVVSVVFNLDVLKSYNAIFNIDDASSPVWAANVLSNLVYSSGNFLGGIDSGQHKYAIHNSACSAATDHIATFGVNTAVGFYIAIDGRVQTNTANGVVAATPTTTAYMFMGYAGLSGSYLNGKVVEAIAYNVSDSSEISWVEGYLANKYGITLADGHLFKNAAPENAPTTYNATGSGSSSTVHAKFVRLD